MASSINGIYNTFIIALDAAEQLDSTPLYLGLLEVMKQDIEARQKACIDVHMRPEITLDEDD